VDTRIRELIGEIRRLEDELEDSLNTQTIQLRYRLDGTRVKFENSVRAAHGRFKTGTLRWLIRSKPLNVISAPAIYAMVVPFVFLDLAVTIYQYVCFPLYGIPRLRRNQFIVVDRHHLSYLNSIEKLNCIYCGYISGLIAYVREIVACTEQYWCPIKHARKILDPHRRYARFAQYGDPEELSTHSEKMREALKISPDE
jgi:hypothetical protein